MPTINVLIISFQLIGDPVVLLQYAIKMLPRIKAHVFVAKRTRLKEHATKKPNGKCKEDKSNNECHNIIVAYSQRRLGDQSLEQFQFAAYLGQAANTAHM